MGIGNSSPDAELQTQLNDYTLIKSIPSQSIQYLEHKVTKAEYLLRELSYNDREQADRTFEQYEAEMKQLKPCTYIAPLVRCIRFKSDQYCSTLYKLYLLYEYPQRSLSDQINERALQRRNFNEKDIWSVLASCILGLFHLRKAKIKHGSLRSNIVLLSQKDIIQLCDPFAVGTFDNFQIVQNRLNVGQNHQHIYLPPEQCAAFDGDQNGGRSVDQVLADVWTLGMIILQAGLLEYQDVCYRDEGTRIHWDTLNYNLSRFEKMYSPQLTALVRIMLSKDPQVRLTLDQLESHMTKLEQNTRDSFAKSAVKQADFSKISAVSVERPSLPIRDHNYIAPSTIVGGFLNTPPFDYRAQTISANKAEIENVNVMPFIPSQPQIRHFQPQIRTIHCQVHNSQHSQFERLIIRPSNISYTRPIKSVFPQQISFILTKPDENLVAVDQSQLSTQVDGIQQQYGYSNGLYRGGQPETNQIYRQQMVPIQADRLINQDFTNGLVAGMGVNTMTVSVTPDNKNHLPLRPQAVNNIPMPGYTMSNSRGSPRSLQPVYWSSPVNQKQLLDQSNKSAYVIETFQMGSRYEGYKLNGLRHGEGKFIYQDGGMYQGSWKSNKMEGFGRLFYQSNKLAYQGEWLDDKFHGKGNLYNEAPEILSTPFDYRNFDKVEQFWIKFEGNFLHDLKHGRVRLFLSNGESFEGLFADDVAEGQGVYYRMDGSQIKGRWSNNQLVFEG